MSRSSAHLMIVGMTLGFLGLGVLVSQRTAAQAPAPAPAGPGRFQLFSRDRDELILLDTATGRCWSHQGYDERRKQQEWLDLETPPARK